MAALSASRLIWSDMSLIIWTMLVISPEHTDTIKRDGWTKAQVRGRIQEASARPIRELLPDADAG